MLPNANDTCSERVFLSQKGCMLLAPFEAYKALFTNKEARVYISGKASKRDVSGCQIRRLCVLGNWLLRAAMSNSPLRTFYNDLALLAINGSSFACTLVSFLRRNAAIKECARSLLQITRTSVRTRSQS